MVNNMYADAFSLERLLHRQKSLNRRISAVIVLIVATLAIGLVQYSQSFFFSLALFCLSLYLVVIQISTENKIAEILHRMDFSLSQFEDRDTREVVEKKLTKLFGNIPQRITSNAEMARTRGGDEKGPITEMLLSKERYSKDLKANCLTLKKCLEVLMKIIPKWHNSAGKLHSEMIRT